MNLEPVSSPQRTDSRKSFGKIEEAITRFPLIVRTLADLEDTAVPYPGDADIRHGCERALTSMLSELARINREDGASPGGDSALEWLHGPAARRLVDADKLERMEQLIDAIRQ